MLRVCANPDMKNIMSSYIGAIEVENRPSTPTHSGDADRNDQDDEATEDVDADDNDDIDGQGPGTPDNFHDAFRQWIQIIMRQSRAAGKLTSLSPTDKARFSGIDFDIVSEKQPDTTMEAWEVTVTEIFKGEENAFIKRQIIKALHMIASGVSPNQDPYYVPLRPGAWTNGFKGAVHCEAMIAIRNLETYDEVSFRLNDVLSFLLMFDSVDRYLVCPNVVASHVLFYSRQSSKGSAVPALSPIVFLDLITRSGRLHYHGTVRLLLHKKSLAALTVC